MDTNFQISVSSMVHQVCESSLPDPNLSLILEICDVVNQRGKQTPRECLFTILKHVNRAETTTEALHALELLDYVAKNCSYPVHLILSTKEFLNELVRRFPERPIHISRVQYKILLLIKTWNITFCENSRYKRDFKHINDMYRLLQYKGYRFPDLSSEQIAALNAANTIKTEEQLEEEDHAAHGAKLEELLRLGTPAALAQANDLMKVMSGFVKDESLDYKKEVDIQFERIEQKTVLLNDMILKKFSSDRYTRDSEFENLHGFVVSAQSQIRKTLESVDDATRTAQLIELNGLINLILENYDDFKEGKPPRNVEIPSIGVTEITAENKPTSANGGAISLIDFDDTPLPTSDSPVINSAPNSSKGTDDLLSLDFSSTGGYSTIPPNIAALLSASSASSTNSTTPPIQPLNNLINTTSSSGLNSIFATAAMTPSILKPTNSNPTTSISNFVSTPSLIPQTTGSSNSSTSFEKSLNGNVITPTSTKSIGGQKVQKDNILAADFKDLAGMFGKK